MKRATTSIRVFGIYLFLLGCALILAPNLVLAPFGIPSTSEVWLRVVGVLAGLIGYYYLLAARAEFTVFYRATIPARAFVFASFVVFVLLRLSHPALVIFGTVDLIGAAWTLFALRASRLQP